MARTVLVPLDDSEPSWEALQYAVETDPATSLRILHVIDPAQAGYGASMGVPTAAEEWFDSRQQAAKRMFEEARSRVESADATVDTDILIGNPARRISEYPTQDAEDDRRVDAIVMGSHGRDGVARILLGSVAESVARRSPVPVTIVR
jgi:nucleotide-binding universal stress UspA family protein